MGLASSLPCNNPSTIAEPVETRIFSTNRLSFTLVFSLGVVVLACPLREIERLKDFLRERLIIGFL